MKQMLYLSVLTAAAMSLTSAPQMIHGFEVHTMTVTKPSPDDGAENFADYEKQMDELKADGWRPSPKEAYLFGEKNAADDEGRDAKQSGNEDDEGMAEELKKALEDNTKLASDIEGLNEQLKNQGDTIKEKEAKIKELQKELDDTQATLVNVEAELKAATADDSDEGGKTEQPDEDDDKPKSKKKK